MFLRKIIFRYINRIILSIFLFLSVYSLANASAGVYLNPSVTTASVDDSIAVSIRVSSDESINAISGDVLFPSDKLELTSLSKTNSIVDLWPANPTFSNKSGEVHFEGVVLNPGFIGEGGRVLTMNFKVKEEGDAQIHFSSASVLANDGQGTNVLNSKKSLTINLVPGEKKISQKENDVVATSSVSTTTPIVTSSTQTPTNEFKQPTVDVFKEYDIGLIGYKSIGYLSLAIILTALVFALLALFWGGLIILARLKNKFFDEISGVNKLAQREIDILHNESLLRIKRVQKIAGEKMLDSKTKNIFKELLIKLKDIEILTRRKIINKKNNNSDLSQKEPEYNAKSA